MQSLRQEIEDRFSSGRFSWEDVRPHDASGLLKQFLRDLPTPLLTFQYLEAFAAVQSEFLLGSLQLTSELWHRV